MRFTLILYLMLGIQCSVLTAQQCLPGQDCTTESWRGVPPNYGGWRVVPNPLGRSSNWLEAPNPPSRRLPVRSVPSRPHAAHETIVRIEVKEPKGVTGYGSGIIVDVREGAAYVLTAWHLFMDRKADGKITALVSGKAYGAVLLDTDAVWDLAVLKIRNPGIRRVLLTDTTPKVGQKFFLSGFGPGTYQQVSGRLVQFDAPVAPGKEMPFEFAKFGCTVRNGDSGGPILDARGRLVGVVSASQYGNSYGSCFPRIRNFLRGILPLYPNRPAGDPFRPPELTPQKPVPFTYDPDNLTPPVIEITVPAGPPTEINYEKIVALVFSKMVDEQERFRGPTGAVGSQGPRGQGGPQGKDGLQGKTGGAGPTPAIKLQHRELCEEENCHPDCRLGALAAQVLLQLQKKPLFKVVHKDPETGEIIPQVNPATGEMLEVQEVLWGDTYNLYLHKRSNLQRVHP